MPARPLRLTRPALFRASELAAIEDGAVRILEEIGIEASHLDLEARAQGCGLLVEAGRIRLPRSRVEAFLQEARGGRQAPGRRSRPSPTRPVRLRLSPSIYPQRVHDLGTDNLVPFTADRLVEAARLVNALAERGLNSHIPGCPADAPAPLQVLMQYRIAAENLQFGSYIDPKSVEALPYLVEMLDVTGQSLAHLPVYVFSPLRLSGESLHAVMLMEPCLESVWVSSMPTAGGTAPVRPAEALALAAAEIIGSALILRECIRPAVNWSIGIHPFDLRGIAMSLGSPECLLFQMASAEVDAYFHGADWRPGVTGLHTLAQLPGAQAAAEKMSVMAIGALLGTREFGAAGTLGLDDVFSPAQLLIDLEMKDHVERLVNGLDTHCDAEACLKDVREGMESGFLITDRTLERYRELYWHPRLFERRFLGPWLSAGGPRCTDLAREMARELVAKHDFAPSPEICAELGRIYRRAEKKLASK